MTATTGLGAVSDGALPTSSPGPPLSVRDFVSEGSALTPEHLALREAVRSFLDKRLPTDSLVSRTDAGHPFDRRIWQEMADALGLQGLAVAEAAGGAGYGWVEQAIVFHELGRVLYPGPYLSTVGFAIPALQASGDPGAAAPWLAELASGSLTATVTLPRSRGEELTARGAGQAHRVDGRAANVLSGSESDVVFVRALSTEGPTLFAVRASEARVDRRRMRSLDLCRDVTTITFDGAPAVRVGAPGRADEELGRGEELGTLALAAEQAGGIERSLEMGVDYAKVRHQFDRPIGSFQAVKHTCTRILFNLESVRALYEHAAWIVDNRPELTAPAVAACGAAASEGFAATAYDALHIHGGLGFTWEHPMHLYYRRAKASELLVRQPAMHREILARWVLDGKPER
jgi:alkylation response protein AidB-like acyl-CoA dehydrogenase